MTTMWKPCGNKILVKMDKVESVSKGGIILGTASQTAREDMSQMVGTIVATGPGAWADQPTIWAKVGDRVKFAKFAGYVHTEGEGESQVTYRVMHDLDVVMVLETNDE